MNRDYKNIVFTKHALGRLAGRSITQDSVWHAVNFPDSSYIKDADKNSRKFIRSLHGRKYHVVCNYLAKEKKWLVISVWVRGEEDAVPLVWQLITLPFRIVGWGVKAIWKVFKTKR